MWKWSIDLVNQLTTPPRRILSLVSILGLEWPHPVPYWQLWLQRRWAQPSSTRGRTCGLTPSTSPARSSCSSCSSRRCWATPPCTSSCRSGHSSDLTRAQVSRPARTRDTRVNISCFRRKNVKRTIARHHHHNNLATEYNCYIPSYNNTIGMTDVIITEDITSSKLSKFTQKNAVESFNYLNHLKYDLGKQSWIQKWYKWNSVLLFK